MSARIPREIQRILDNLVRFVNGGQGGHFFDSTLRHDHELFAIWVERVCISATLRHLHFTFLSQYISDLSMFDRKLNKELGLQILEGDLYDMDDVDLLRLSMNHTGLEEANLMIYQEPNYWWYVRILSEESLTKIFRDGVINTIQDAALLRRVKRALRLRGT